MAEALKHFFSPEYEHNMSITIKNIPETRLAALVEHAPNITFHSVWKQIHAEAEAQGLLVSPSRFLGVFKATALNGPAGMTWYGAALTVEGSAPLALPIEEVLIPAGKTAIYVYRGPYDGLPNAWGAFVKELAVQGLSFDSSRLCTEEYKNDPRTTAPNDLISELAIPIH